MYYKYMAQKTVLFIEDNPLLCGLYQIAFEKAGIATLVAHDGERGLELAKEKLPDLIVLDILIPGMSGFEILEALKKDAETKNTKVVILTVLVDDEIKKKAEALGAVDYMIKSELDLAEIVQRASKHLG